MLLMLWKPPVQIVYVWCHLGSGSIRSDCIQFYDGILATDDFARMGWLAASVKLQLEFKDGVSAVYVVVFFPTALGMLAESTKKQDALSWWFNSWPFWDG